ncbi:hypothetical protein [Nocardioides sp. AE5]|uniref:hypothetical protein n=1 Tax=Nocardioides sp. AE5 TaxID=2962573 RepID=UPI0028815726|nr:hypothetical protein [Nocardioides sp. AE5]MDT0203939.1 hypothetical protein [Nocardioides sp. AE5]
MTPPTPTGLPRRPLLRPGSRITQRGDGLVQVGLTEPLVARAPDTPTVRAALDGMRNGVPPETHDVDVLRLCMDLVDRGLVLDADLVLPALGAAHDAPDRADRAALVCEHGDRTPLVLAHRESAAVAITHSGLEWAADHLEAHLVRAGVRAGLGPAVVVHLHAGQPDRDRFDDLVRDDFPHLLVVASDGEVRVGPFVVPGQTACLRCIDAHLTDRDPRWPLVVAQHARQTAVGGVPEPVPQDLMEAALVWVARDVTAWIDGREPRTWSATIDVRADLELPLVRWRQHAGCGCSWGQAVGM